MTWQPSASMDALRLRARLNRLVREFFFARDVLEVETPMMSRAGNTDPTSPPSRWNSPAAPTALHARAGCAPRRSFR